MAHNPNIALLLVVAGGTGICAEFCAPGTIVPGVIGSVLALMGIASLAIHPISWLGALLILLAPALFVLEAKFATRGILTAGGAVTMALGSLMLIDTPDPNLRIRWITAAATVPFAAMGSFLISIAVRACRNKAAIRGNEDILKS